LRPSNGLRALATGGVSTIVTAKYVIIKHRYRTIYGLIQDQKLHKAMALVNKMQEDGITPGVITYTTLIQGQCKKT
jgi:pentatricopeptide repeat protein